VQQQIPDAVKAAAGDASQSLIQMAAEQFGTREKAVEQMVKPIAESLQKVDGKLETLEKSRHEAHGGLIAHLKTVTEGQDQLRRETSSLVTALRAPATRGRWGELQLKRVCEMAGMIEHCDFEQQRSADTDDGRVRPDLIVKLPGGMNVVVDAKVPLEAYLNACEAEDDDVRSAHFESYGRHVRDHLRKLGAKSYQDSFSPTPEFVVLFLPSEAFHSAALEQVPDLIQEGVDNKVLIATPTSLIGLLKVVAYGWRQERMAESAEQVADLGRQLHKRIATMAGHLAKLGRSITTTANDYNATIGSLERQVLASARRFDDLGVDSGKDIEVPAQVETAVRSLQAPELVEGDDPDEIRIAALPKLGA
jgi:DNA recombination protein RmuC